MQINKEKLSIRILKPKGDLLNYTLPIRIVSRIIYVHVSFSYSHTQGVTRTPFFPKKYVCGNIKQFQRLLHFGFDLNLSAPKTESFHKKRYI